MEKDRTENPDEGKEGPEETKEGIRAKQNEYYHKHKDHINETKKIRQTAAARKQCEYLNIPVVLAPYIKFKNPAKSKKDRISLNFDSRLKLFGFLIDFLMEGVDLDELLKIAKRLREEENLLK